MPINGPGIRLAQSNNTIITRFNAGATLEYSSVDSHGDSCVSRWRAEVSLIVS
jgi:hypothetical protein